MSSTREKLNLLMSLPMEQKVQLIKFMWSRLSTWKKVLILSAISGLLWKLYDKTLTLWEKSLKNDLAVITGAGSGLGRLLSLRLAKEGCRLALWDLNQEFVEKVKTEIQALGLGTEVRAYVGDVSDYKRVYELAEQVKSDFGTTVDILVNNAGIVSGKNIFDVSEALAQKTVEVNTIAHFWTVKAFVPDMMKKNHGHVVTVASAAGTCGVAGMGDYCASKFGAVGFDESLRNELKKRGCYGVKTTCVCPYYINTGMFDGVKALVPMLEQDYVINQMVKSIKRNDAILMLPVLCYFTPLFRFLFPTSVSDGIAFVLGLNNSMDQFKGNEKSVKRS